MVRQSVGARGLSPVGRLATWVLVASCVVGALAIAWPAQVAPAEVAPISAVHLTWTKDPSTSVVVTWRSSKVTEDACVEIWPAAGGRQAGGQGPGPAPGQGQAGVVVRGQSHSYRYAKENVIIYDAEVAGLLPDTAYDYVVRCQGETSPVFSFRTALEAGARTEFRFAVMGDSRGGYDVFGKLMRLACSEGARFVVFTGDMTDGASQVEWDLWFAGASDTLPFIQLMTVHGNHEMMSQTYYKQFALPGEETHYSLDFGMAHFAILLDNTEARLQSQVPWLVSDLSASRSRWKFAALHKSVYSGSPEAENLPYPREILEPVVEEHGVAAVFSGHVHNYERTLPLLRGKPADKGVVYLVAGGAGAPLVSAGYGPWTAATASVNHVVILKVSYEGLEGVTKTADGAVIDVFTVAPRAPSQQSG